MRVLIFGQTGVCHKRVRDQVKKLISEKRYSVKPVHWILFEDRIVDNFGRRIPIVARASAHNETSLRTDWAKAFIKLINEVEDPDNNKYKKDDHIIISLHACLYRDHRFILPVNIDLLKVFKPDLVITLIDDLQDIWYRLSKQRFEERHANGYFRLDEIANWRSVETTTADMISRTAVAGDSLVKNYVFAVKHPTENLFRLLFERDRFKRVYACCPITKPITHHSAEMRVALKTEVDNYRSKLHEDYIVFDPLTIDEYPILRAFKTQFPNVNLVGKCPFVPHKKKQGNFIEAEVKIARDARWILAGDDRLIPGVFQEDQRLEEIRIPANEVIRLCSRRDEDAGSLIDDAVTHRDLRLVDQCEVMPAWRPYLLWERQGGQNREIDHAGSGSIPTVIYWPDEDGPKPKVPLFWKAEFCKTPESFYNEIRAQADELANSLDMDYD